MGKLFGTDGIRGLANKDLTSDLFLKVAFVGAHYLAEKSGLKTVVVGHDPRESAHMLKTAVMSGICAAGLDVIDVGMLPTPAIAYLTRKFRAAGGAVISASHNPAKYNGLKFFDYQGLKLSEAEEELIEQQLAQLSSLSSKQVGRIKKQNAASNLYLSHLKTVAGSSFNFKLAVDCANGATSYIAPKLFTDLGATVKKIACRPDGKNINAQCGSTHIKKLQEFVKKNEVDIGLAFDGDGDRVLAVSPTGELIDGDFIMAIIAAHQKDKLAGSGLVTTVMSNLGFDLAMKELGLKVEKTKVGDRFVLETMLKKGYKLGGEQSGHIIMLDYNSTGDGLITALLLLKTMHETKQSISTLAKVVQRFPQVLLNVQTDGQKHLAESATVLAAIADGKQKLGAEGRILVRPSGTEPVIRVMVESKNADLAQEIATSICQAIEKEM